MTGPQWSTVISDACLAVSGLHAAYRSLPESSLAAVGFATIGAAATCGSVRFSQSPPGASLVRWHTSLSWLAGVLGLPAVAAAICRSARVRPVANALLAGSVAVLVLSRTLGAAVVGAVSDVLSALSLLTILAVCGADGNLHGVVGAVLYIAGSLVLKVDRPLGHVRPVDTFHYALMFGNVALMLGITRELPPLFYGRP